MDVQMLRTPLHHACSNESKEVLVSLLHLKANVNAKDEVYSGMPTCYSRALCRMIVVRWHWLHTGGTR